MRVGRLKVACDNAAVVYRCKEKGGSVTYLQSRLPDAVDKAPDIGEGDLIPRPTFICFENSNSICSG